MPARQGQVPTTAELEAFGIGQHLPGAEDLPGPRAGSPLLQLAVETVVPVLAGAAGALAGGAEGRLAGVLLGQVAGRSINLFGQHIVSKWLEWLRGQDPANRAAALTELAELPPEVARGEVTAALAELVPQLNKADRQVAIDYLSAIPGSVRRSLLSGPGKAGLTLPPALGVDEPVSLLQLLPAGVPPYPAPAPLPGTEYQLEELIGSGGFGAVYRASSPSLQHLPLAIKFCLDRTLLPALRQERDNLERLMKAGGEGWSPRIVRLYGYNLEHQTPFLVYEYVPGGDLVHWLLAFQAGNARGLTADEVLLLITQVAEALAFAHQCGLVHRDLKPANVLMEDGKVKLADFGIGGPLSRQVVQASRISTVAASQLSPAEQVSLFRGTGTPLYMSPEQKRGAGPDPRQDLYSLGVMWYQLLIGDVTREMGHGWARELEMQFAVPVRHISLIERCVGWIDERPRDAGELLRLLQSQAVPLSAPRPADPPSATPLPPKMQESDRSRRLRAVTRLRQVLVCHEQVVAPLVLWPVVLAVFLGLFLGLAVFGLFSKLSWLVGLVSALSILVGLVWVGLWLRWRPRTQGKRTLAARIDQLLAEFPQECQTWGGRAVLTDRDMVQAILRELETRQR
jgi:serine/threonine protein kinase